MVSGVPVTWKLVVISSPIQHIGRASEVGADLDGTKSWEGDYRVERDRLLKFVDDQGIDNVVFLTTDNHNTMINNLRYRAVPEDPRHEDKQPGEAETAHPHTAQSHPNSSFRSSHE